MHSSIRKKYCGNGGQAIALFVILSAFFSARSFAQVPVQVSNSGLGRAELSSYTNYESTDFTFDLSELPLFASGYGLNALDFTALDDDHGDQHKHSIKCQKVTDLDFGSAFSGVSPGTVVMDPNTNISRKSTGGAILDNHHNGHPAHIQLTIYNNDHCDNDDHCSNDDNECSRSEDDDNKTNDDRSGFTRHGVWNTISFPSSSILSLTLGGQTYTMTADNYTFIRTNGNFYIGATLHVGANQVSGVYTGSFTVTQTCD